MSMAAQAPSRRDAATGSIKPRVLIVEDETALVELLRYNLEQSGFLVSVAYDGEEALASVQEDVPDLILLDWMLPLMSGIEVCHQLRRQTITANLPIIMLTARGEEGDRVRGLDAGEIELPRGERCELGRRLVHHHDDESLEPRRPSQGGRKVAVGGEDPAAVRLVRHEPEGAVADRPRVPRRPWGRRRPSPPPAVPARCGARAPRRSGAGPSRAACGRASGAPRAG